MSQFMHPLSFNNKFHVIVNVVFFLNANANANQSKSLDVAVMFSHHHIHSTKPAEQFAMKCECKEIFLHTYQTTTKDSHEFIWF